MYVCVVVTAKPGLIRQVCLLSEMIADSDSSSQCIPFKHLTFPLKLNIRSNAALQMSVGMMQDMRQLSRDAHKHTNIHSEMITLLYGSGY